MLTWFVEIKDIINSKQNPFKNLLVGGNAVTEYTGSCLLRVMGFWF